MQVSVVKADGTIARSVIKELFLFEGLSREKIRDDEIHAGEICAALGMENIDIGDTISDFEIPEGFTGSEY
jgi:GTP-binding protein